MTPPCRLPCSGTSRTWPREGLAGEGVEGDLGGLAGGDAADGGLVDRGEHLELPCRLARVTIGVLAAMVSPGLTWVCRTVPSKGARELRAGERRLGVAGRPGVSCRRRPGPWRLPLASAPSSSLARASCAVARLPLPPAHPGCAFASVSASLPLALRPGPLARRPTSLRPGATCSLRLAGGCRWAWISAGDSCVRGVHHLVVRPCPILEVCSGYVSAATGRAQP